MAARRRLPWILLVAFVVVPLLEIWTLIQVGQVIGAWWTIGLLVLDSIIGTWLIRREGARAWRALRSALDSGRLPGDELADGALILVGGTLMLSPGFVTDALGILLVLPLTRPLLRRVLGRFVSARLVGGGPVGPLGPLGPFGTGTGGPGRPRPDARHPGPVVRGEVVED